MTQSIELDLDQLAINTIRTLAMDAVQAANSRPPGHADGAGAGGLQLCGSTSCATTPAADLAQPRPLRALGRPCLDAAVLAAAPGRRARPSIRDYETLGEPSVTLDDIKRFRQLDSPRRPPRVPLDHRRRDHHRPARPGRRQQRRLGHRQQVARRATTTGPASSCSTTMSTRCAATAT